MALPLYLRRAHEFFQHSLLQFITLILILAITNADHDEVWLDGPSRNHGRLQISHENVHGYVCSEEFADNEIRVVCKNELGYPLGGFAWSYNIGDKNPSEILEVERLGCSYLSGGLADKLSMCKHSEWGNSSCLASEGVGLTCAPNIHVVQDDKHTRHWEVKDMQHKAKGYVMTYHKEQWQTVCLPHVYVPDQMDALLKVVCKSAGCSSKYEWQTTRDNIELRNNGPKLMIKAGCTGQERDIRKCSNLTYTSTDDCMDFWLSCSGSAGYRCNWLPDQQNPHAIRQVDHTGPIVGAIVTGIVAIIGVVTYCYCTYKKRNKTQYTQELSKNIEDIDSELA
ncbi:PREDICTED: neurotrypsin-like [Priapulus caudatus]|uniref:Neurotrypsin-like n=1 Tax=Priapulus caudatus TaxID=37621 RepID=A0ABM1DR66_PRICU|nr:PREDICTED: neurotrypsin-like [Priapulus caudatus]